MFSKQDVLKAASLAKLQLTSAEEDKFANELASIVAYVDELKKVATSNVTPMAHAADLENSFRPDEREIDEPTKFPEGQQLIAQAPKTKNGYVVVPRILTDL